MRYGRLHPQALDARGAGKVVALDNSEGMLAVARENASAAGQATSSSSGVTPERYPGFSGGSRSTSRSATLPSGTSQNLRGSSPGCGSSSTPSGEFAFSIPFWVEGREAARDAFRAKAREVLLAHGLSSEALDGLAAKRPRREIDLPALFRSSGFRVESVPFDFKVSTESRAAWRQISMFSGDRREPWLPPGLDPATQNEVRAELGRVEEGEPATRSRPESRWRIYLGRRSEERAVT